MNTKYWFLRITEEELDQRIKAAFDGATADIDNHYEEDENGQTFNIFKEEDFLNTECKNSLIDIFLDIAPWGFRDRQATNDFDPDVYAYHDKDGDITNCSDLSDIQEYVWEDLDSVLNEHPYMHYADDRRRISLEDIELALREEFSKSDYYYEAGSYLNGKWFSIETVLQTISEAI